MFSFVHKNARKRKIMQNKKTIRIFTTLILLISITIPMIALQTSSAHDPPWTISTYAFIVASPNPVGVGQTAYVNFWIDKVPPTAIGLWGTRWHDFELTVTKPDGTTARFRNI